MRLRELGYSGIRIGSRYFILLTQDLCAEVSECDYLFMASYFWIAVNCSTRARRKMYAYRKMLNFSTGKREKLYMHRELLGFPAEMVVDHINGESLDNRRENLRVITHYENLKPTFYKPCEPWL